MNFNFTKEQQSFRKEWRTYLEENLPDGWVHGAQHELRPDGDDEQFEFRREWQRQLYEDGWAGPSWPEEYGGMDLSPVEEMIYAHERARVMAPHSPGVGELLAGPTLIHMGTDWQKERFIPNILNAEEVWSQGYSEPAHGSDIAGLECASERNGDEFVINGQKIWNSQGYHADYVLLMTRSDTSGTKHEGITALIVDMDQSGVTTERIHQIDDNREFTQVFFDDAVAPEKHVVGEEGEGWDVIRTMSAFEQSWTRAFDAERRLNEIIQYAQSEKRGGQPMSEDDVTRREIAELDMRTVATKMTRYRQISERIDDPVPGPEGSLDVVMGDELMIDVEEFGIDMVGPEMALWEDGLDDGERVKDWLLWNGLWIGGGSGDIQRNIIGEQILGLPKDPKSKYSHRPKSERPENKEKQIPADD
jgi:alkylation response protein AidB-like acyl-CoA dehydrogenase